MPSASAATWRQRLTEAVELHQADRLQDAIALYRDVLTVQPQNGDALHLLGMALEQSGAPAEGQAYVERAIAGDPKVAAYRNSLGNIHRALNDTDAAVAAYGEAVRLDPRFSEAHNNLGLLKQQAEDWPAAMAHFQAALQADPAFTAAAFNLTIVHWQAGQRDAVAKILPGFLRVHPAFGLQVANLGLQAATKSDVAGAEQLLSILDEASIVQADRHFLAAILADLREDYDQALRFAETALALQSTHRPALQLAAKLALRQEKFRLAVQLFDRAVALDGQNLELQNALSCALTGAGDYDRSLPLLRQLTAAQPDRAILWSYLADTFSGKGMLAEACDALRKAIALDPDHALHHANLAVMEGKRNNLAEVETECQIALGLDPKCAVALDSLANLRATQYKFDEAEVLFRRAIAAKPHSSSANGNFGIMLLRLHRYAEAWPYYAWRWKMSGGSPDFSRGLPAWDGRTPPTGRLMVWHEQGLGDQILYASLIGELAARGCQVVLATEPRLLPLFKRSFPMVQVVLDDATLDPVALGISHQCPIGDVASHLRLDDADFSSHPTGYLKADPARQKALRAAYLRDGVTTLAGVSWASSKARKAEYKSLRLDVMAPFMREPGLRSVSLQYGEAVNDVAPFRQQTGIDLLHDAAIDPLLDIDAQAAQIAALDIVVTVSTTAAHLAAALGKPTLILLPEIWGQLWYWGQEGETSPWYPTVRLCRCMPGEDLASMLDRALIMFREMRAALPARQADT